MNGVAFPDEAFSISVGRVEDSLELLDALLGAAQSEDALNASGYTWLALGT